MLLSSLISPRLFNSLILIINVWIVDLIILRISYHLILICLLIWEWLSWLKISLKVDIIPLESRMHRILGKSKLLKLLILHIVHINNWGESKVNNSSSSWSAIFCSHIINFQWFRNKVKIHNYNSVLLNYFLNFLFVFFTTNTNITYRNNEKKKQTSRNDEQNVLPNE